MRTYLFDVAFQVHVNTLPRFAIMPLYVLSTKAQECVHAHIEASLGLLRTKTNRNTEQQHKVGNYFLIP